MPQTSPFNWTLLLSLFLITLATVMVKISYTKILKPSISNQHMKNNMYYPWLW